MLLPASPLRAFPVSRLFAAAMFVCIGLVFLHHFPLGLILLNKQPCGGDVTSHFYFAWFLRYKLMPARTLLSWSNDLLMGYPTFQYYFPLSFVVAALLGLVVPLNVAFKIMFIACSVLVPAGLYRLLRALRIPFPAAPLGAVLTMAMMFTEKSFSTGFYMTDNLKGQFSSTLAMGLFLLFLASLFARIRTQSSTVPSGIWLALACLAHAMLVPLYAVLAGCVIVVFSEDRAAALKAVLIALVTGFGLFAFWAFPFVFDTDFSASPPILKNIDWVYYTKFFDPVLFVVESLALAGAFGAWKSRAPARRLLLAGWVGSSMILALSVFANRFGSLPVLDRYLPFHLLAAAALAGSGFADLTRRCTIPLRAGVAVILAGALLCRMVVVPTVVPAWARYYFSGLEDKYGYAAFRDMTELLRKSPGQGRVSATLMRDSPVTPRLGGPFVWEILPMFTGKPSFETATMGYYSLSYITISRFLADGLLSHDPERLARLCEFFNIEWIVKSSLHEFPGIERTFRLVRRLAIDHREAFDVLERRQIRSGYVAAAGFAPVLYRGGAPHRDLIIPYLDGLAKAEVPVVLSRRKDLPFLVSDDVGRPPANPILNDCRIPEESVSDTRIRFQTTCPGMPHIIRISYHPGWRALTGEEVFQILPNYMLIYPKSGDVELDYGPTWAGRLGRAISILTGIGVCFSFLPLAALF